MKLKKWTIKQVLFEREMNHPEENIYFNGFKLPKDKDFLLAALEELYKHYWEKDRQKNLDKLQYFLKSGTRFVEIKVDSNAFHIYLLSEGNHRYPEENGLSLFDHGDFWVRYFTTRHGRRLSIPGGYHIHKHCLVNPLTGR